LPPQRSTTSSTPLSASAATSATSRLERGPSCRTKRSSATPRTGTTPETQTWACRHPVGRGGISEGQNTPPARCTG
jgi:hypothetical protein